MHHSGARQPSGCRSNHMVAKSIVNRVEWLTNRMVMNGQINANRMNILIK